MPVNPHLDSAHGRITACHGQKWQTIPRQSFPHSNTAPNAIRLPGRIVRLTHRHLRERSQIAIFTGTRTVQITYCISLFIKRCSRF